MSKEYPLYPELTEQGQKEAQELINSFKGKLKSAAEEVIGDLYCNIIPDIESDSWTNFRNDMMDGFKDYNNSKIQARYDFKAIRKQILKDHYKDIVKDLNQDMVEEIKSLNKTIDSLRQSIQDISRY